MFFYFGSLSTLDSLIKSNFLTDKIKFTDFLLVKEHESYNVKKLIKIFNEKNKDNSLVFYTNNISTIKGILIHNIPNVDTKISKDIFKIKYLIIEYYKNFINFLNLISEKEIIFNEYIIKNENIFNKFLLHELPFKKRVYMHSSNAMVLLLALKYNSGYLVSKDKRLFNTGEIYSDFKNKAYLNYEYLSILDINDRKYFNELDQESIDIANNSMFLNILEYYRQASINNKPNFHKFFLTQDISEELYIKLSSIPVTFYGYDIAPILEEIHELKELFNQKFDLEQITTYLKIYGILIDTTNRKDTHCIKKLLSKYRSTIKVKNYKKFIVLTKDKIQKCINTNKKFNYDFSKLKINNYTYIFKLFYSRYYNENQCLIGNTLINYLYT